MSSILKYCMYYFILDECISESGKKDDKGPLFKLLRATFNNVYIKDGYINIGNIKLKISTMGKFIALHPIYLVDEILTLPDFNSVIQIGDYEFSFIDYVLEKYTQSDKLLCHIILETARIRRIADKNIKISLNNALIFLLLLERELFPSKYWILFRILRELLPENQFEKILINLEILYKEKLNELGFNTDSLTKISDSIVGKVFLIDEDLEKEILSLFNEIFRENSDTQFY